MSNEEQKREVAEAEALGADERKIALMLGNLRTIAAPKDFDFRLKARIANGAVEKRKSTGLLPVLGYALPLSAVLLIGAFFALNSFYTIDERNVPSVAETSAPSNLTRDTAEFTKNAEEKGITGDQTMAETAPNNSPSRNKEELVASTGKNTKSKLVKRAGPSKRSTGGSVDRALKGLNKTISPRDANPINKDAKESNGGQITAMEILSSIGIDADVDKNVWKVKAVRKNSRAERSGVRTGDEVEAIDDRPLPLDKSAVFSGKTLRIRRDNKPLEIKLQNE